MENSTRNWLIGGAVFLAVGGLSVWLYKEYADDIFKKPLTAEDKKRNATITFVKKS